MNVFTRVGKSELIETLAPAIHTLSQRLAGRLVSPGDAEYDAMRALPHANWDHEPLFVARVGNAADVADVVDFVRTNGLEIAIRSGGHSVSGHGGTDHGVVVDLRDLKMLEIDREAMTVWAGAGLTAGEVSLALDEHQVVVGFGDTASVGIGGLTLGGGMGYLSRRLGLTMDALLAVEIVTASGDILIADETNEPDLFWAVRGGGGNFGVVTRFKYRLHALPEFVGGPMILPATPENLAGFVAAASGAPKALSTIAMVMPSPPLPFLSPDVHGKVVLFAMIAYAGPIGEAQQALAPFRALATPLADLVRPGPYSMMYMPEDPGMRPSVSVRSGFVNGISLKQASDIIAQVERCGAPMRMAQVRVLGGAVAEVSNDATAYAHRQEPILAAFLAMDGGAEAALRHDTWATESLSMIKTGRDANYVNFLADEGLDALKASYPGATWTRLSAIKRRYDPNNLFRLNQNIPPA